MIEDTNTEIGTNPSAEGLVRVCTKCEVNLRPSNSSWCRVCRNNQAAEYRARTRQKVREEHRVCAWAECGKTFVWSSRSAQQVCCSRVCHGKWYWRKSHPELNVPEGKILCTRCGLLQDKLAYSPSRRDLKRSWCKDCARAYQKDWDRKNVERRSAATRRSRSARILKRYGAPSLSVDELLERQGGCAICGVTETIGRGWHIDHDHRMAEDESYRGILCHNCNIGVGNLHDDPVIISRALAYITNVK